MLQLTAEHATLILHGASLPALKGEHRVTRNVISAIPPDKADYRPDDIAKSAFDLAWHIVSAEVAPNRNIRFSVPAICKAIPSLA